MYYTTCLAMLDGIVSAILYDRMPLGLYLHYPFCTNLCAYCDYYKEAHNVAMADRFFESLKIETELVGQQYGDQNKIIDTIYIGGGTPSLAGADQLENWITQLKSFFTISPDLEFSLECNPESVSRDKLEALKAIGVTRPVFGIQSFDRKSLKKLDRRHRPEHSFEAVYLANALGFKSFGVDLLFGLPGQTHKMLTADIDLLVDLDPNHISFYHLTAMDDTRLAEKVGKGKLSLPEADLSQAMYQGGVEQFAEFGIERYEVCSFSKPGHECRHNIGYWSGKSYLGLGPGAHSFIGNERFSVVDNVAEYTRALSEGVRPIVKDKSGETERRAEAIMLGLRLAKGMNGAEFLSRFGVTIADCLLVEQVELLVKAEHLIVEDGDYRLNDTAFFVADEITQRILK